MHLFPDNECARKLFDTLDGATILSEKFRNELKTLALGAMHKDFELGFQKGRTIKRKRR